MSRCIPAINPGLSIPELIKIVKHSFRECEFNEVQDILMHREKKMKFEIENLKMDHDSIKKEVYLLERSQSLIELEKFKIEEKLKRSERKCEELDTRVVKMGEEIEDMRRQKLAANQTVEELRRKKFEADQVVDELRRENLEANRTLDELRLQKMESDKAAEGYKSRVENLEPRMMKVEGALAEMLKVKVEDLAVLVNTIEKSAAEGVNVALPDSFKGGKDGLGNDSTNADAENVIVISPKKGGGNLVHSSTKDDGANTARTSPGSQSGGSPPHVESNHAAQDNEGEDLQVSGPHASLKMAHSPSAAGDVIVRCDSDDERNLANTTYVSDTSSGQINKRNRRDRRGDSPVNLTTKRKRSICISDEEYNLPTDEKQNQVLESTHDRVSPLDDVPIKPISDTGLPQSTLPSDRCSYPSGREERLGPPCGDSQTLLQEINVLNDVDSADSDNESSYSDAQIDNLVAAVRSKTLSRT